MSERWTLEDDMFVHAYLSAIGSIIGPRDLGRSPSAVKARAVFLRKSGAWQALDLMYQAERDYFRALGHVEIDVDLSTIRRAPSPTDGGVA